VSVRTGAAGARRRGGPLWWVGLVAVLTAPGAELEAQVPDTVPAAADTLPTDAVAVPIPPGEVSGDTIPEALREAAEAPTPALLLPRFPAFGGAGWDVGRWEWTAAELARLPGMTVLEFVERIPGVVAFRGGGFGRPEGLTALGMGGARVRVFLDGFELDPHTGGAYPLEMISVVDIRRLRVERAMSTIFVHVETFVLDEPEPVSIVALGTGVYQTRLLRGLFSRGFGTRSVGTAGFDLSSTAGIGIGERYRHMNASVRWDYVPSDRFGLQVEWRRTLADRAGEVAPLQLTRGDLVFRARASPTERIALEAFVGRSGTEEDGDPTIPERVGGVQGGASAAVSGERIFGEVTVRGRSASESALSAPGFEAEARGGLRPHRLLSLEGSSSFAAADTATASRIRFTGTIHPVPVLSLFASTEMGSALVPLIVNRAVSEEADPIYDFHRVSVEAGGLRGGIEVGGAFGAVGAAAFRSSATEVAPFGLAFDRGRSLVSTEEATGIETYFRLPVPGARGLLIDGWYTRYSEASERLYAPDELGRVGLSFHGVYIGGQLEPSFRLEGIYRGSTPVPAAPETDAVQIMPGFRTLNFSLQLRIIDVTAFLIWDNMLAEREAITLPGAPPALPRIVYGGSWRFRN
jgi:hypothetical protein